MQDFRKLKVWEKAHALAIDIFRDSESFPNRAGLALSAQLRRSALSISANIAEGAGKPGAREFRRFLEISLGSAAETHNHLLVAHDLNLLTTARYAELSDRLVEVRRMLTGLIKRVNESQPSTLH